MTPSRDVDRALMRIEAGARDLGRHETLRCLLPGVSSAVVTNNLAAVGLPTSPALEAMWAWRDGTSEQNRSLDDVQLFPGFYMLSTAAAATSYDAFRHDQGWNPGWLPIFANGGGDFYFVIMTEVDGPVGYFQLGESEHPVEFRSLADFLRTLAEAYATGLFFIDERARLEMDDEAFARLTARVNRHAH